MEAKLKNVKPGDDLGNWTHEIIKRERKLAKDRWHDGRTEKMKKWPAYLSVGIFFVKNPSNAHLATMRERGLLFPMREEQIEGEKITITGFRLVEEKEGLLRLDAPSGQPHAWTSNDGPSVNPP